MQRNPQLELEKSAVRWTSLFGTAAAVLVLWGCAESARDSLEEARKALAETRYPEAIAAADAGLAREPDHITSWGLELVKLEALARGGRGDEAIAQVQKLVDGWPDNMGADQFAATADELRAANQGAAAIRVLDLGLERFPNDEALLAQIEAAKTSPAPGSEELKMLQSLGYVE
jgi:tetratricopeptide (TPR) repeat protein